MPAGYTVSEELYQGRKHAVWRATRDRDQTAVIIKSLLIDSATNEDVANARREYEILSALDIDGVVKPHELRTEAASLDLVLEDVGGLTLAEYASSTPFDLGERLRIATRITEVLAAVHRAGVIHKDLTPRNILVRPDTCEVTLIDFSISTLEEEEHPAVGHPRLLEGTPAYLAPEQTGRMNRPIDYRCDFYSLGVTLFYLFSGSVPFQADDPMRLVHHHLAVPAPSVRDVRPDIPECVATVIDRLLQKAPEDRYQSASGIAHDLRECQHRVAAEGREEEFVPGTSDVPDRFSIPRRLYGRDRDIDALLQAFMRVCDGGNELILVTGDSGIGKSSLVHELHKPIAARAGYFVSGKFDQLRRTVPYTAIVDALTGLVRQLLTETDESLAKWRETLAGALGGNGQLVIDMIPEVENVIGPQLPVEELDGPAARDRFHTTFCRFIQAFCDSSHPVVLFLDDLQWADEASLALVDAILTDLDARHLLLIGAYRDDEVGDAHPLVSAVEALRDKGATVTKLGLRPLDDAQITRLLADTLHRRPKDVRTLQEMLSTKTGGNPFFLWQFLITLKDGRQLTFDYDDNRWKWDVASIEAMAITDNVVELMVTRLLELPEGTQATLRLAACVGNRFELSTLKIIQDRSDETLGSELASAVEAGLIVARRDYLRGAEGAPQHQTVVYHFLHDRVHQAAYSLVEEASRPAVHLKIGRQLLRSVDDASTDERLFAIVDHLNLGREQMTETDEVQLLARLNRAAASRALSATAYEAAKNYALQGLACAGDDAWSNDYDLAKALHRVRAEATYLSGDFEASRRFIDDILPHLETPAERAELYNLVLIQQTLSGHYVEAVDTAVEALSLLGVDLPAGDLEEALDRELTRLRENLGGREPTDLLELPEITSQDIRVALQILGSLGPLSYIGKPALLPIVAARMVNLSLVHGNTSDAAFGYVLFGLLHSARALEQGDGTSAFVGDYETAYDFGLLAMRVSDRFSSLSQQCRAAHVFCTCINHWTRPLSESLPVNSEGFHAGVQSGELQFAGYLRYSRAIALFHLGGNLSELLPELEELARFSIKTRNQHGTDPIRAAQRAVVDLTAQTPRPASFDAEADDDRAFLEELKGRDALPALCHYLVMKSQVLFLYGRLDEAAAAASQARERLTFIPASISIAVHNFYESLILAALAGQTSGDEQQELLARVRQNQAKMETWSQTCAANFSHKFDLVRAELSRLESDGWKAAELYDQAIEGANRNGYRQEEALARELAGRFWLEKGFRKIAAVYLREAHYGYRFWGATRKADLLEQEHRGLFEVTRSGGAPVPKESKPHLTLVSSTGAALDFASIMEAARTISAEIDASALIPKLVGIAVQNAGAQRGCLLLKRGEELLAMAESSIDGGESLAEFARPVAEANLASTAVNYAMRTGEVLVVPDATTDPTIGADPYVREHEPKSILCVPIVRRSEPIGLLYLEHRVAADVFTEERVGVLQSLAAQAAISLENAELYQEQRRTQEQLRATLTEVEEQTEKLRESRDRLQKLNRRQHTLLAVNDAISSHLERDKLFTAIAAALDDVLEFDRMGVYTRRPESDSFELYQLEAKTLGPTLRRGVAFPLEGTALGPVFLNQDVFVGRSLEDLEPYPVSHKVLSEEGINSNCIVPLVSEGDSTGVLVFYSRNPDNFTPDVVELLREVGDAVAIALDRCLAHEELEVLKTKLEQENIYLQEEIKLNQNFEEIIGRSPEIREALEAVETVAPTLANVLITGETGTGKELIARAVHNLSGRGDRPLIKVNCATIPKDLFESEFFGHVKGAFTGALKTRAGRFEIADKGTLFLDEVGEIPIEMQSKLLRVLQEGEFERVGEERTRRVDVRIIAATNRDLDEEVEQGRFRQDLYYRLNVYPIHVAPLRDRPADVPLLAAHFLERSASAMGCDAPDASENDMKTLQSYDWPGNVRELQNVIERAVIASRGGKLRLDRPSAKWQRDATSPGETAAEQAPSDTTHAADDVSLAEVEKQHILRVLEINEGNKAKTARELGIDPKTLYKRLREYGLLPPRE